MSALAALSSVLALPQEQGGDKGAMSARVKQSHLNFPSKLWSEGMGYHALLHGNSTDEYRQTVKHRYYEQAVANASVNKAKIDAKNIVNQAQRDVEAKIVEAQKELDAAMAKDTKRLRNLINVAESLGVTLQQTMAFENCSMKCDKMYWCGNPPCNAHGIPETQLQDVNNFNNKDLWSSCFAGCNLGVRTMPSGNNPGKCKSMCYHEAKVPWWCTQACDDYAAKAQAFKPVGKSMQHAAEFNDKLKLAPADPSEFADSDPAAMKREMVALKEHIGRLKEKLGTCEMKLDMYE